MKMFEKFTEMENLENLTNRELDFLQLLCNDIIDQIAGGKDLRFFEKNASKLLECVNNAKLQRLIHGEILTLPFLNNKSFADLVKLSNIIDISIESLTNHLINTYIEDFKSDPLPYLHELLDLPKLKNSPHIFSKLKEEFDTPNISREEIEDYEEFVQAILKDINFAKSVLNEANKPSERKIADTIPFKFKYTKLSRELSQLSEILDTPVEDIVVYQLVKLFQELRSDPIALLDDLVGLKYIENKKEVFRKLEESLNSPHVPNKALRRYEEFISSIEKKFPKDNNEEGISD